MPDEIISTVGPDPAAFALEAAYERLRELVPEEERDCRTRLILYKIQDALNERSHERRRQIESNGGTKRIEDVYDAMFAELGVDGA